MPDDADSSTELTVVFPPKLAWIGVGLFSSGLAVAIALLWSEYQTDGGVSWLGLVLGTGAILGISYSLTQVRRPSVQLRATTDGLVIYRRNLADGSFEVPWRRVRHMNYQEKVVGTSYNASNYKVVRLRLDEPPPPQLRYFEDDEKVLHLDAFAAEPGGEELLRRLEALRDAATGA